MQSTSILRGRGSSTASTAYSIVKRRSLPHFYSPIPCPRSTVLSECSQARQTVNGSILSRRSKPQEFTVISGSAGFVRRVRRTGGRETSRMTATTYHIRTGARQSCVPLGRGIGGKSSNGNQSPEGLRDAWIVSFEYTRSVRDDKHKAPNATCSLITVT